MMPCRTDTFGQFLISRVRKMFSHYLKTALRNIRKNWVYSILSICCLAIGTAMFSAFFYGINYEYYKYNRRPLYNRSAIVYEDMPGNDGYNTNRSYVMNGYHMPVSFEMLAKLDIPEIELISGNGTRTTDIVIISDSTKVYNEGAITGLEVCGDFFKFHNLTLLYGDRTPQNDNEIVVTESFLKRIGYNKDISLCTVKASHFNREYCIVNVIRDDVWSRYVDEDIFYNLSEKSITTLINPCSINADVVLKEDVDINDVNRLLSTSYIHENSNAVVQLSHTYPKPKNRMLSLLTVIVLLVAAINFFKHTVTLLKQRGRANIIRYSLGAGSGSLSLMMMVEVLLVLACSLAAALYISFYVCSWFNTTQILSSQYFNYKDIAILDIIGTGMVGLAGIAVCFMSVKRQNRLLRQRIAAERRESKTLKYIVIGLETTIAVFALAVALYTSINAPKPYNPLPKQERLRTFYVENDEYDNVKEFYDAIRKLPQVDDIIPSDGGWDSYPNYNVMNAGGRSYHFIIPASDKRYFNFFNIPVEWLDPIPPKEGFLIDRKIYDEFIRDGVDPQSLEFPSGSAILGYSNQIHVSGIFDHLICDDMSGYTDRKNDELTNGRQIIMNRLFRFRDNPDGWSSEFFVKFNRSVSPSKAESLIRETWSEMFPLAFGELTVTPMPEYVDEDLKYRVMAFNLGSIICILLVILSVSSSISAETNMRRKEVALRKINGAKARNIMELFIKPYGIILAVSFVIGNLAAFAFLKNDYSGHTDTFLLIAPASLLAMALIIMVTIFRRIRIIMRTNPADVIKSE